MRRSKPSSPRSKSKKDASMMPRNAELLERRRHMIATQSITVLDREPFNPKFYRRAGCLVFMVAVAVTLLGLPPKWVGIRSPIIIVPGLGGSQMEARLVNKSRTPSLLCHGGTREWFALWLNLEPFVNSRIGRLLCWTDNVRLEWDLPSHTPHSPSGVEVRVSHASKNSTESVERVDANAAFLDFLEKWDLPDDLEDALGWLNPFKTMVHRLVEELGYVRGHDIFAAPYDFRKSPLANEGWQKDMKKLIERTAAKNGERPVTLICHSMGGLYTLHMLAKMETNWIAKHVLRVVLVSVPFGGSARALSMILSGDDFDIPLVSGLEMRRAQRTFDSPYTLIPSSLSWGANDTLVYTPARNFSSSDYEDLFAHAYAQSTAPRAAASPVTSPPLTDASLGDGGAAGPSSSKEVENDSEQYSADMMMHHFKKVSGLTEKLLRAGPPRVPILCMYSYGIPTPGSYLYGDAERSFETPVQVNIEDGDGTVSRRSLRVCEDWSKRLKGRLKVASFGNVSHFDMMRDPIVVDSVMVQLQQDIMKKCSDQDCPDPAGLLSSVWFLNHWRWLRWRHRWGWLPRSLIEATVEAVMRTIAMSADVAIAYARSIIEGVGAN
mmetsp:Transcript_85098/g.164971  ORF Transcript_85098/g.164971 Transcript_85098/m.164971 type:complete len:607 (+) Transcript_85098:158-1978(+)